MAGSGLTFKLFGEDVSASSALEKVGGNATKIAGGIGAAFGAVKVGDALTANFDNEKVTAVFTAGLGQTPAVAKAAGDLAGQLYRGGLGESLADVETAVGAVGTSMGDLSKMAPADIGRITTSASAVATVMGTDVTEVTRAAGQMFKNGLAPSAEAALDIIAQGTTSGANASGDLIDTLTEYGPSFSAIGVSGGTMTAMLKSGLDSGIVSTDKAADAFNEFGIRAIDGSKSTGTAYKSLGLDADKMSAAIAGGGPKAEAATGQIMSALGNMTDPVAQEAAGVALFGSMWEDCGSKAILSMNPATQAVTDTAGAAQKMGETLADNGATKVEIFKRGMDGLLQDAVQLPGPLGDIVAGVMAFGPSAMAAGAAVAGMVTALKGTALATKLAAAGQWLLNAAMSANPIMLIIIAIVALVAGFIWLWNNVEGFRNFFIAAWEMIKTAFSAVWTALVAVFTVAWNAVKAVFTAVVDAIVWYFRTYWNVIVAVFNFAIGVIKAGFALFVTVVTAIWNGMKTAVAAVGTAISTAFTTAVNFVRGLFTSIGTFIAWIWGGIKNGVATAAQWIKDKIQGAITAVQTIFTGIGTFVAGIWTGIKNGVATAATWIKDKIQGAITAVQTIFTNIGTFIAGIWTGIKNGVGTAAQWVSDKFQTAITTVQTIFTNIGTFIGGVFDGVKGAVETVRQWIQDKFQAAVDFVKGIFGGIGDAISGAFSGIADFVKAPINAAINLVNGAIDALNNISFDIPDWVPIVGGKHFGLSIGHIPNLAAGGIVMPQAGGQLVRAGEAGQAEAIVPLSKWAGMTGGGGTTVVVNVSGAVVGTQDQLAQAVLTALTAAQRRGAIPRGVLV